MRKRSCILLDLEGERTHQICRFMWNRCYENSLKKQADGTWSQTSEVLIEVVGCRPLPILSQQTQLCTPNWFSCSLNDNKSKNRNVCIALNPQDKIAPGHSLSTSAVATAPLVTPRATNGLWHSAVAQSSNMHGSQKKKRHITQGSSVGRARRI